MKPTPGLYPVGHKHNVKQTKTRSRLHLAKSADGMEVLFNHSNSSKFHQRGEHAKVASTVRAVINYAQASLWVI